MFFPRKGLRGLPFNPNPNLRLTLIQYPNPNPNLSPFYPKPNQPLYNHKELQCSDVY